MTDFVVLTVCCMVLGAVAFCCALLASTGVLPRNGWVGTRARAHPRERCRVAGRAQGGVEMGDRRGRGCDVCCLTVGFVLLLVDDGVRRAIWGPRTAFVIDVLTAFPYVFSAYRAARGVAADQKHDGATKAVPRV